MVRQTFLCIASLLVAGFLVADANITWVNSQDGAPGVLCSVTCGNRLPLQAPAVSLGSLNSSFSPQACAVNSTAGTMIGTLWYNKNVLSCHVYNNTGSQPVSSPSSAWYCLCLDRTTTISNTNGSVEDTCASSCSKLPAVNGTFYNNTLTSCKQPAAQSVCFDTIQSSFGYQASKSDASSDGSCLTVNRPAQTTADTLPVQRTSTFQCLCSDANSTANLQISDTCSTVPYATPIQPKSSSSLSTGAIVGIAVGCAAAVAILIAVVVALCLRRRSKSKSGVGALWTGDNKNNMFGTVDDHEAQFGTVSSDLVTFGALQGKGNKSYDPSSDGSIMTSDGLLTTNSDSKATDMTGSVRSLANIVELQNERQDISGMELPFPERRSNGAVDKQVPRLWSGGEAVDSFERTVSGNNALEEVGLLNTWKIEPTDLHVRMRHGKPMLLGEGGYGKVYRGVLNKAEVAIKVVTSHDADQQAKFVQEIVTLRACHNTNIVQFLGACIRDQQTFMAMEFMHNGDLFTQIDVDVKGRFTWYKLGQRIAMDVCKGLCYLHSKRIAHLDLKSPNVLLTSNYTAKIGDVGLGKIISNRQAAATRQGSLFWAAPEQLLGTECSTACDVFAFGTVLWEICSGEKPLNRHTRPLITPTEAPKEIEELIIQCHAEKPADRPTADQCFDILRSAARKSGPGSSVS